MSSTQQLLLGEGAGGGPANYIEDVFSTYLYVGNTPSTNTITNGIDLSTKGGLVWIKERNAGSHSAWDTARGVKNLLIPNQTAANLNIPVTYPAYPDYGLQSFNSNGFTLGKNWEGENAGSSNIVSWTFRKQPKFFDIVTYTGNGSSQNIAHNLGSVPGCIITKGVSGADAWYTYHRGLSNTEALVLNTNAAKATGVDLWNSTTPTSTQFSVGNSANNNNGATYVAYIFAHNAGGFGLTGTDNVISCGSYVGDGSGDATVNLGYEPQFLLVKLAETFTEEWRIFDTMRGWDNSTSQGSALQLVPNTTAAETTRGGWKPTATGFQVTSQSSGLKVIYIAIRRGPMKVPTVGTSVYNGIARTGNGTATTVSNSGFTPDMVMSAPRTAGPSYGLAFIFDRLRGPTYLLETRSTQATQTGATTLTGFDAMNGYIVGVDASGYGAINANAVTYINWNFQRAPGFFDEVCYTGTGVATTVTHNLAAVPELMIVKVRSNASGWQVYASALANTDYLILNTDAASVNGGSTRWNSTTPTSSVFSIGTHGAVNGSGDTYVAYLFATCAGVSKVGGYTGTGTTLQIDCGFTGGARFVLIKRTDSTGDWYVWDSARGIIAGNDPYLLLNSTAAEVTNTDYVDTAATGFEISSTAPAGINANGGTYIFLAIA